MSDQTAAERKPDGWHTYHICDGALRELTFVAGRAYCPACDEWSPEAAAPYRAALERLVASAEMGFIGLNDDALAEARALLRREVGE